MARPKKAIDTCTGHKTKAEIEERKKQEQSIKVNSDKINCPKWLNDEAKKEFKRIKEEMQGLDLLTNLDILTLAIYADAYSKYVEATKQINDEGLTIEFVNTKGATNTIINPSVQVQQKYIDTIMKCATKLGLSISDRLKLIVPEKEEKPKNKFGDFL